MLELLDCCASDLDVVNAARVSMDKYHDALEEGDDKLIYYLMKNRHGTPFEHNFFKFRVEAPIFVFREWHRHRIGHSYNEMSGRYVELPEIFYAPEPDQIRSQEGKPGRYIYKDLKHKNEEAASIIFSASKTSFEIYRELLEMGVAKEQARAVLPVGTHSKMIWSCNARSLMNFLELRTAPNALKEIRELADQAELVFADKMPITYNAWVINDKVAP